MLKLKAWALIVCFIGLSVVTSQYTYEEQALVKQLRDSVQKYITEAYMDSDAYLIRWIRVSKQNVAEAEKLLRKNLAWRTENRISGIVNETIGDLSTLLPYSLNAVARDGRPVLTYHYGGWNVRKAVVKGGSRNFVRYLDQMLEKAARRTVELANSTGSQVSSCIWILDMDGYNVRTHSCLACLVPYRELVVHFESYYPGIAGTVFLINTPRVFNGFISLIQPFLTEETRGSLLSFGHNKAEWKKVILGQIQPEQLDLRFGGRQGQQNT